MDYQYYSALVINGITTGCIYGLLGLALVYVYRSTNVINMALGEAATFSSYLMWWLMLHFHWFLAFISTIVISFFIGAFIHVGLIRKIRDRDKIDVELNEMIITVGLISVFYSACRWFWGVKVRTFPSPFPQELFPIGGLNVPFHSLGIVGATLVISLLLYVFFKFTKFGLASEAVASNRFAASLKGIRVDHILAFSWGLSAVIGAISGILIAPLVNLQPGMLSHVFLFGFTAAVVGGLKSPGGTLVSGVFVGILENISGSFEVIGNELKSVVVFFFLILVLYLRPRGLFGKKEVRKV